MNGEIPKFRPDDPPTSRTLEDIIPGILPEDTAGSGFNYNEGTGGIDSRRCSEAYAENLLKYKSFEKSPELRDFFKPFKNQVVVDLGAGARPDGFEIALKSQAKAYVGVEAFNGDWLESAIEGYKERNGIHVSTVVVDQDMLSFLQRLPDKSVSVFASGFDASILPDLGYESRVCAEIERVLHPEGAFMTFYTELELDEEKFNRQNARDVIDDSTEVGLFLPLEQLNKYSIKVP